MLAYAPREQKKSALLPLAAVAAAHIGLVALAMTMNPALVTKVKDTVTKVTLIEEPAPPPPPPQPAPPVEKQALPDSVQKVTVPDPIVDVPTLPGPSAERFVSDNPIVTPTPPQVLPTPPLGGSVGIAPVAVAATLLTSGADLQPDYPASKLRIGEEAVLRLKLAIDARGRVTSVEPVGEADRAFLRAAERHLKRVWRYAPATKDGVAVASTTEITLRFVLR